MNKDKVRSAIVDCGIIPVIRAASAREALLAVEAVCCGGIRVAEITMTVGGAIEAIRHAVKDFGEDAFVGAGTVLDADTARRCLDAGAAFIVSPGFDFETIVLARSEETLVMAGALTPTEIMSAARAGSDIVKVFPCGNMGGADYIRSLKGTFAEVPMVPTGGVNLHNAEEFVRAGAAALGVGRELVKPEALRSGKTNEIVETARLFLEAVKRGRAALNPQEALAAHLEIIGGPSQPMTEPK